MLVVLLLSWTPYSEPERCSWEMEGVVWVEDTDWSL